MALKYILLAFVAVLAVQSEAKVIPPGFFHDGQELYALAKQGRLSRQCLEDNFMEIVAIGDKMLGELGECGDDIHKLALAMLDTILAATMKNLLRIYALLDELDACKDDLQCVVNVSLKLVPEVIEADVAARFIIAQTAVQVMKDFPESVACVENVYNINIEGILALNEHFNACFVL